MMDLFCIAYHSRIIWPDRNGVLAPSEVERILEVSIRNNARDGITGALMLSDDCFVQVLEGPRRPVQQTFDRILQDPRHLDVTMLQMSGVDRRSFPDWSMGFVSRNAATGSALSAAAGRHGFSTAPVTTEAMLNFFIGMLLRQAGRNWTPSARAVA
jgi:blue light- and temperature-responsive anti-repressor